jgi:hypothetical protein
VVPTEGVSVGGWESPSAVEPGGSTPQVCGFHTPTLPHTQEAGASHAADALLARYADDLELVLTMQVGTR